MKNQFTICTRSALGTLLAGIILMGALASAALMDATVRQAFYSGMGSVWSQFGLAKILPNYFAPQGGARMTIDAWVVEVKKMPRPQALTYYAVAIVVAALSVGMVGYFLRRYRYRIFAGSKTIERRAMWLFFIPGLPKRVSTNNIRRLEVTNNGEGTTMLVMTLNTRKTWTLKRGGQKKLQRLGSAVARVAGLERRDFLTWG